MLRKLMPHVFVNGISAKSGGGQSILTNFLRAANGADDSYKFTIVVPDVDRYEALSSERIHLIPVGMLSHTLMIPYASLVALPKLIRELRPDLVFNLADIPIATTTWQVFLFDWSYAAFPDSIAWRRSGAFDTLNRYAKMLMFKWLLRYVDALIAQNNVVAGQLQCLYKTKDIYVVNNAVSIDNLVAGQHYDFELGGGFKLLCLSAYYTHKNIEIFIPLAQRIKMSRLDIKIITTIDPMQNKGAEVFLKEIDANDLGGVIKNVGNVPMADVPSLYRQTDALLLPTLLESFSGTYVEAMFHRKPILTSDLPFARGVCGEGAFYFDPLGEESIFDAILKVINDPVEREIRQRNADRIYTEMPSWSKAYQSFTNIFSKILDAKRR